MSARQPLGLLLLGYVNHEPASWFDVGTNITKPCSLMSLERFILLKNPNTNRAAFSASGATLCMSDRTDGSPATMTCFVCTTTSRCRVSHGAWLTDDHDVTSRWQCPPRSCTTSVPRR